MLPCEHKKMYHTAEEAGRIAAMLRKDRDPGYLRVYSCPHCGLFHLTSRKPEDVGRPRDNHEAA